jgi:hypothetical protein
MNIGNGIWVGLVEKLASTFSVNPAALPGIVGWFDAQDAATITNNVNGNTTNAANKAGSASALTSVTNAYPLYADGTIAGKKCWRFNGTTHYLQATIPVLTAATIFVVLVPRNVTLPASNSLIVASTKPSGATAGFAMIGKTFASTTTRLAQVEGTVATRVLKNKGNGSSNYAYTQDEPMVLMGSYASGGAQTTFRLCAYTNNSNYGQHDIYEVLVFDGVVSLDTQTKVEYYLNTKYGLSGWAGRPLNVFTKIGKVIDKPVEMNPAGAGCYYSFVVDMTGVANFPKKYAIYFSTDHDPAQGGIYLYIADDLTNPASYKSYTQAVIDGDFNYLGTKPSANPIYKDTTLGDQTETPEVRRIGSTIVLTYQNAGAGNNQSTLRAKGTDGVNFTRDKVIIDYDPTVEPGDAHTGYFKWNANPFDGVPYQYVGYSLHGGQTKPLFAQWGTNDPVNGDWTKLAVLQRWSGRLKQGSRVVEPNSIDLSSVVKLASGNYVAMIGMENPSAGAGARDGAMYEVLLDPTGRQILGMPIEVIPKGGTGLFDNGEVATSSILRGSSIVGVYTAADASNVKTIGAVSGVVRDKALAYFAPLFPAIPAYTEVVYDFTSMTSLPAGFTFVSSGSSLTFDANGVNINCSTGGYGYIYIDLSFVPTAVHFVDVFFEDWRTQGTGYNIVPALGFGATKAIPSAIVDGFYFNNGLTTANAYRNITTAGVNNSAVDNVYNAFGYNNFYCNQRKQIGVRWFVDTDNMYALGHSQIEYDIVSQTRPDNTKTYTPFFGISSPANAAVESIKKIIFRYGS